MVVIISPNIDQTIKLKEQLEFFLGSSKQIYDFPSQETLAYDQISPHQDISSQRLLTLKQLLTAKNGFLIATVGTAMQKLPPVDYVQKNSLLFSKGQTYGLTKLVDELTKSSYTRVKQVLQHGDFSVRGEIIDIFPMGKQNPLRLDFFDDEIETIKEFDVDSQRSSKQLRSVKILPANEIPLDQDSIERFKKNWQEYFSTDSNSYIYQGVVNHTHPAGIEYYLPFFFDQPETIFDYLPTDATIVTTEDVQDSVQNCLTEYQQRFNQCSQPAIKPKDLILLKEQFFARLKAFNQIVIREFKIESKPYAINFFSKTLPAVQINHKLDEPMSSLLLFMKNYSGRILFIAESAGRREILKEMFLARKLRFNDYPNFASFLTSNSKTGIAIGSLEVGLHLPDICIITESSLFGSQIKQRRAHRETASKDNVINSLVELQPKQAVVHVDLGIGRYQGLKTMEISGSLGEYLTIEYDKKDILYVPVDSLNLIHRYSGADAEKVALTRLGSNQWAKAKSKAKAKAYDVAAELLEIYSKRKLASTPGIYQPDEQYQLFAASFPFEPTYDQQKAIDATIADMQSDIPMDRLVCGDVGFGKTEIAMRAAFLAVQNNRQAAILAPTTLLAQQHFNSFSDRFADWAISVVLLSRMQSASQIKASIKKIKDGNADIIIGTHMLFSKEIIFNELGLLVIDEEHRFGVKQKEKFKAMRAEIDILTLTATPIPRTLNLSLSGIRDLSIIATAPNNRIAIKTFVHQWDGQKIKDSCTREINRGGQVYYLHNNIANIDQAARELSELIPKANIAVAHGQMNKNELEQVMLDFYHRKIHILVCTTIIENGLDVPNANTIIINRADKLGLAQMYQIRGRVGRSHHQAYAYLIIPEQYQITDSAKKRLKAISAIEELGAGFSLALQDMEIRGSGEILGDEQSGQIIQIGFAMYSEILEQAINDLKNESPTTKKPQLIEIKLGAPALFADDFIPDVNIRLVIYQRISNAHTIEQLQDIKSEVIDRFGVLPEYSSNLFEIAKLKLQLGDIGIKKISGDNETINLEFNDNPNIDPQKLIKAIQLHAKIYKIYSKDKLRICGEFNNVLSQCSAINEFIDRIK